VKRYRGARSGGCAAVAAEPARASARSRFMRRSI
jgi:hypothetical protein